MDLDGRGSGCGYAAATMEPPYRLLYRLGITPWDREQVPRPVIELAEVLSASPGRALDVGCGTGRDAVYLATREPNGPWKKPAGLGDARYQ